MIQTIKGVIRGGKIIPEKKIRLQDADVQIKIFVLPHINGSNSHFGKLKGTFGDGLRFQKKARREW